MTDSMRWFSLVIIFIIGALVYFLGPVIMPFVMSFLLAYFLNPLVVWLYRWHFPRALSATLVVIIAIVLIVGFFFAFIPALAEQMASLAHTLPAGLMWLKATIIPWLNGRFHLDLSPNQNYLESYIMNGLSAQNGNLTKLVSKAIFSSGYFAVEFIFNLIMIPVVTLYLLIDWVYVTQHGKRLLPLPAAKRDAAANLIKECGTVLSGFLRGQLLVMIGAGVVYSIGLSIVGLNTALLIGVVAGVLTIVPYLGFISGLLIALIAAAVQFHSGWYLIGVLIVFGVETVLENFVFYPWFVGDRIGLHPVAVIFAVLAGGKLFGFLGVLLALPAAAIIMVFFRHLHRHYFGEELGQDEGEFV